MTTTGRFRYTARGRRVPSNYGVYERDGGYVVECKGCGEKFDATTLGGAAAVRGIHARELGLNLARAVRHADVCTGTPTGRRARAARARAGERA